jgi:Domain of unknown function (DUF5071)
MIDPVTLLPRNKHDIEHVQALIELGYPGVAPILPNLLEWTQDPNWPVAGPLGEFLASIGDPIVKHVADILRGGDGGWKYTCIHFVVRNMRLEIAAQLTSSLDRLVTSPTPDDIREEVNLAAQEALDWLATGSWPPDKWQGRPPPVLL